MTTETRARPDEKLVTMWKMVVQQDATVDAGDCGKTIVPTGRRLWRCARPGAYAEL